MVFAGFLLAFLYAFRCVATESVSNEEAPIVTTSQGGTAKNLLPDLPYESPVVDLQVPSERDRSDIKIEKDQPFGGYFYPKPSKPFYLPSFKALDGNAPTVEEVAFAEDGEGVERQPRSPQRWRPHVQPPPPFIPGFIPPHQIRPLPALYGRLANY